MMIMFEIPEIITIRKQMQDTLVGRQIQTLTLNRSEKLVKWGFLTQTEDQMRNWLQKSTITSIERTPYILLIKQDNEISLAVGELDGTCIFHRDSSTLPKNYILKLDFEDNTTLTVGVKLWGLIKVITPELARENNWQYEKGGIEPMAADFSWDYFSDFIHRDDTTRKLNVKKFITSRICVTGLGNGHLQEILFRAGLHPKRKLMSLSECEEQQFFQAIREVTQQSIRQGGRSSEKDLFGNPGGFISRLSKDTKGKPCSVCSSPIEKIQHEGGACYFCPTCQTLN